MSTENRETLLAVSDLKCSLGKNKAILHNVNFEVHEGDILILQGKSGSGKSTLLKCLAHLNLYEGEINFHGKTPKEHGIPTYRLHVLYVPQRPSLLPGTPRDFIHTLQGFSAYKSIVRSLNSQSTEDPESIDDRAIRISSRWGVQEELWDRNWPTLSGGEAQRISLAAALALDCAEVILLDEPTSALDTESSSHVERELMDMMRSPQSSVKALVWITHSVEQAQRVGTRFLDIKDGSCHEVLINDSV